jgi:hypothetical protein
VDYRGIGSKTKWAIGRDGKTEWRIGRDGKTEWRIILELWGK